METTKIQQNIENIKEQINAICLQAQNKITEKIYLTCGAVHSEKLIKNFININLIEPSKSLRYVNSFEKLKLYLNLLKQSLISKNKKRLLIISNLDKLVERKNLNELNDIIKDLLNYNLYVLVESNEEGFVLGNEADMEYINIVGDINLTLPDLPSLTNTINSNYPLNHIYSEAEVFAYIKQMAHNLFSSHYNYKYTKADVIIKILNSFYYIDCGKTEKLQQDEINFLL